MAKKTTKKEGVVLDSKIVTTEEVVTSKDVVETEVVNTPKVIEYYLGNIKVLYSETKKNGERYLVLADGTTTTIDKDTKLDQEK